MKAPKPLALLIVWSLVAGGAGAAQGLRTGSISDRGSLTGGAGSYAPKFSADGRFVVFLSHANNLATNDDNRSFLDVFRHDLVTGETVLVSVNSSGHGGGDGDSSSPDVSADGRIVAFVSAAGNLVNNDTNGQGDVFVRDLEAGVTTLVSVNAEGTRSGTNLYSSFAATLSGNPRLSADGRKVIFDSLASDLVPTDINGIRDVFMRDLDTATTLQLSAGTSFPADFSTTYLRYGSFAPVITPDGNRVAFVTTATNDVPRLGNPSGEICVRDVAAGRTFWASSNAVSFFFPRPPDPYTIGCSNPVISANGRYVLFIATTPYPFSPAALVYHDLNSAQSRIIYSNTVHSVPAVSADGRYVAYADNSLVPAGIYLWDAQTASKTLVSVVSNGVVRASHSPAMTPDGRFVAFLSSSTGLVTNEVTAGFQVYVRDVVAGTTKLVSANPAGKGNADHGFVVPAIRTNGTAVAFDSDAEDLVAGDLNRASDVFVRDLSGDTTVLVSGRHATLPSATGPAFATLNGGGMSADGRFLLFRMTDGYEMSGDTNRFMDLIVRDLVSGTNIPVALAPDGQAPTNFTPRESVLSGNGRYVAYVSAPGLPPWTSEVRLLRRDLQTGTDELVTTAPGSLAGLSYVDLRFPIAMSADGNQIAFAGASAPAQIYVRDMAAGTNRLASVNRFGSGGCNNVCTNPVLSADGRWILFASAASDLVTNATGGRMSLFARNLLTGVTELVSIGTNGDPAVGYSSGATFSADSRRVAFVASDVNFNNTVYVRDLFSKTTFLIAAQGEFSVPRSPVLSGDGRYVAFEAISPSGPRDIYVRNVESRVTTLASVNRYGTGGGNSSSSFARLSANGRYCAFATKADNLVAADSNRMSDIFLRDAWRGTTMLVSLSRYGTAAGNSASSVPMMSADGRTLAFQSVASDLTADDFNGAGDIFILNLGGFDTDEDGMDDAWEMAYFNNLSHDGTGDFDHDGATDLQEFLAGTDPTNAGSVFQVLTLSRPSGGTTTALWSAVPGKTYRLQFKTSVNSAGWIDVSGDVGATGSTASKAVSTAPATQAQFFRVVLVQ